MMPKYPGQGHYYLVLLTWYTFLPDREQDSLSIISPQFLWHQIVNKKQTLEHMYLRRDLCGCPSYTVLGQVSPTHLSLRRTEFVSQFETKRDQHPAWQKHMHHLEWERVGKRWPISFSVTSYVRCEKQMML